MNAPRPLSDRLSWADLTDDEQEHYRRLGAAPYDRSQDRTAEEMRPVYEARGYKRQPNSVRGEWDDLTDEEYARRFRHFTPETLVQSPTYDLMCTDPDTLQAVAKVHVRHLRERKLAEAVANERQQLDRIREDTS